MDRSGKVTAAAGGLAGEGGSDPLLGRRVLLLGELERRIDSLDVNAEGDKFAEEPASVVQ